MDHVPLLFAESVAQFIDYDSIYLLKDSRISLFGKVGRSLLEKRLYVFLYVVYNPAAGTFDYCLTRKLNSRYIGPATPYTYDLADHRFVFFFEVILLKTKSSLNNVDGDVTWTTAAPSDPTFLNLLRTQFPINKLRLDVNCPELLKLLPDNCTFNYIYNGGPIDPSEVIDAIIQRSQECGRLEDIYCQEFFKKRGMEASINWIATNKRLRWISGFEIKNPESVRSTLKQLGVQ